MLRGRRLPRSFYARPTQEVAIELLGKYLVHNSGGEKRTARLVEVEAYIGEEDPACHAACGPTKRNAIMYGMPGFAYIYFIYGMYHCLNVVTEAKGIPAAVLIRAAEAEMGFESDSGRVASTVQGYKTLSGPGKLCRVFGLTLRQNGLDLTGRELYLEDRGDIVTNVQCSARIGVRKGAERWWRYFDGDSPAVSFPRSVSKTYRGTLGEDGATRQRKLKVN